MTYSKILGVSCRKFEKNIDSVACSAQGIKLLGFIGFVVLRTFHGFGPGAVYHS